MTQLNMNRRKKQQTEGIMDVCSIVLLSQSCCYLNVFDCIYYSETALSDFNHSSHQTVSDDRKIECVTVVEEM